jgi:hypothetical protein
MADLLLILNNILHNDYVHTNVGLILDNTKIVALISKYIKGSKSSIEKRYISHVIAETVIFTQIVKDKNTSAFYCWFLNCIMVFYKGSCEYEHPIYKILANEEIHLYILKDRENTYPTYHDMNKCIHILMQTKNKKYINTLNKIIDINPQIILLYNKRHIPNTTTITTVSNNYMKYILNKIKLEIDKKLDLYMNGYRFFFEFNPKILEYYIIQVSYDIYNSITSVSRFVQFAIDNPKCLYILSKICNTILQRRQKFKTNFIDLYNIKCNFDKPNTSPITMEHLKYRFKNYCIRKEKTIQESIETIFKCFDIYMGILQNIYFIHKDTLQKSIEDFSNYVILLYVNFNFESSEYNQYHDIIIKNNRYKYAHILIYTYNNFIKC